MTNRVAQARNIAVQGTTSKAITFYQGGPNLLAATRGTDNYQQWSFADITNAEEMGRLGENMAEYREKRENAQGWTQRMPQIRTSPRFTPTPHLIANTELRRNGAKMNTNPWVFIHPAHTAYTSHRG